MSATAFPPEAAESRPKVRWRVGGGRERLRERRGPGTRRGLFADARPRTTETATITVAIPTFNRRALLERAVESVLAETRVPVSVYVSDNASTDGTDEYLRGLARSEPRVRFSRNEQNIGGLKNIAKSVAAVQSTYFVPLADDDFLLPDFLHDAYRILEADRTLGAAVFATEARSSAGEVLKLYPEYLPHAPEGRIAPSDHIRLWLAHGHCAWSSVLWRTEVLREVGVPYAVTGLPGDVDFQARVFAGFPAFLMHRAGAVYNLHDGQASLGFDVTHLSDWASVFNGVDRAAGRGLGWDEYRALRQTAWLRLRPSWSRPRDDLAPAQLGRLALVAGFRMGDWELAYSLAESAGEVPDDRRGRVFSLPGPDPAGPGEFVRGDARGLLLSVVRWFADSERREREAVIRLDEARWRQGALEEAVASARASLDAAAAAASQREAELVRARAREVALLAQVEQWRQRCEREEDRFVSRRARRLLQRLRLRSRAS